MATIISHSPAETFEFGRSLGAACKGGEIFALQGDLGAGKTHLSKGIAAGLGCNPDEVTSPTFTLVHEYRGGAIPVIHFDFYRLESEAELLQLGFDDYLDSGAVLLIEWAAKFHALLPLGTRWFHLHAPSATIRKIVEE